MDTQESPGHGEKGVLKCSIDVLVIVGFLLSNLALPYLLSKENIAHAIIRKLKECQVYCFCLFVIVFMLLNVCM